VRGGAEQAQDGHRSLDRLDAAGHRASVASVFDNVEHGVLTIA